MSTDWLLTLLLVLSATLALNGCSGLASPTPSTVDPALKDAAALVDTGSYTAAEAVLRQALDAAPDDPSPALELSDLYLAWGRPDAGVAALDTAVARGAGGAQVASRRLQLLSASRDWKQVLADANVQLDADSTALDALVALTDAQLHLGLCEDARLTAGQASAARPSDTTLANTHAFLSGDYARLLVLEPELVGDLMPCDCACDRQLGLRLIREGRWALAACLLRRAAAGSPEDAEIHAWLGEAHARLGLDAEADRALRRAVELDPKLPQAWLLLGKHMLATGTLEEARIALLKAQALDPTNPAPCLAIAELKAQMGLYDEIDRWTSAALERAPSDAEIAKAVARVYLSRRLADARVAATALGIAAQLDPHDGEAVMLLGASHLLRGEVDSALGALDDAVTLAPDLAEAHFWRARALDAAGRTRDALDARVTAADLGYLPATD